MIFHTPCKVCGQDITLSWNLAAPEPPAIHPLCDTRPADQRHRPHPAEGHLANLAHDTTLAMAAAAATPTGSPEWATFDQLCEQVRRVQRNNTIVDLAWAARYYTQGLGWPIFPLKPGEKVPLTRHGFHDATTDPDQVAEWWRVTPQANIGIPTGIHFNVVDVDTPTTLTAWSQMLNDTEAEAHGLAMTASGGYHLFVALDTTQGEVKKNSVAVFGPGIDYRTKGGYIVAPFSRRADGQVWTWWMPPANTIRNQKK